MLAFTNLHLRNESCNYFPLHLNCFLAINIPKQGQKMFTAWQGVNVGEYLELCFTQQSYLLVCLCEHLAV